MLLLFYKDHDIYLYMQWTFHPFIYHSKRFYTILIWRRVLAFLVVSASSLTMHVYNILHAQISY